MKEKDLQQMRFFEDLLEEAKTNLFRARSVREIKFLQTKIKYLDSVVKKMDMGKKKKPKKKR